MAILTIPRNYQNGVVLYESDLDNIKTYTENFFNNGVDSDQIQDSSIDATLIASSAVTTAKIEDNTIETTHFDANAVTNAKLSTANYSLSSAVDETDSTSVYDVAFSTSITTNGRPVIVAIVPTGTANSYIEVTSTADTVDVYAGLTITLKRAGSSIAKLYASRDGQDDNTSTSKTFRFLPGCLHYLDAPVAGTYTYEVTIEAEAQGTASITVKNVKLLVYEL